MLALGLLALVAAAADSSCEVNADGTCIGDLDDKFDDSVSLAQLRATLARESSAASEDMEVDMTDLASLDGTDAAAKGGWTNVGAGKGRAVLQKQRTLWTRSGKDFWVDVRARGRSGPKKGGWRKVNLQSVARYLKNIKSCWSTGYQYYCKT